VRSALCADERLLGEAEGEQSLALVGDDSSAVRGLWSIESGERRGDGSGSGPWRRRWRWSPSSRSRSLCEPR